MAENLNLPTDQGVLVQRATGPARKAGVKGGDTQVSIGGADILLGGDVLVGIDGKKVKSMDDVIQVVDSKKPGDEVTLELRRGEQKRTVKVKLGNRPASADSSLPDQGGGQTPAVDPATCGWRLYDWAHDREGEDLRPDPPRGRRAGSGERGLGDRHDLPSRQPTPCGAGARRGDRDRLPASLRGGRGVRERPARRRAADARQRSAHDAAAARRRGPVLLRRGGTPHRAEGDEGGPRQGRARRALAVLLQDRLPHDRRLRAGHVRRHGRAIRLGACRRASRRHAARALGRADRGERGRGARRRAAIRSRRRPAGWSPRPGVKDSYRMQAFFEAVNSATAAPQT